MINITDIRIKILDAVSNVRALASITLDSCFVIHEIKVLEGKSGLFVTMPGKKNADGSFRDIAHPLNTQTREYIQSAVLAQYEKSSKKESGVN